MRFMIIVKATKDSEAGVMPTAAQFEAMDKFNQQLIDAGVMLAGEGLHPSSEGARVTSSGGKLDVVDGPFAETKELIAGFWLISAKDKDEALSWVKRIPFEDMETIEVRRVFDAADFGDAVPTDIAAREEAWRAENEKPVGR